MNWRRLDGAAAAAAGLVLRCVPDDELLATAREFAAGARGVGPELVRRTKQTLRTAGDGRGHEDALAEETQAQLWPLGLPDTRERLDDLRRRIGS